MKPLQIPLHRIPFLPKIVAAILHLLLILAVLFLFLGRNVEALQQPFLMESMPGFYSHVSNFTISYLLLANFGYVGLLAGARLRVVLASCVVMMLANLIYEWWIPFINTRDLVDAWYGIAGCVLALLFSFLFQAVGRKANPSFRPKATT